jgi:hypothetical protein
MRRVSVVISILVLSLVGLLSAGQTTRDVGAQDATPAADAQDLVGSWIVHETLPPTGGPPVLAGIFTFFADGNVLVSGFGAGQPSLQGAWSATGERAGTLTVVGLLVGGSGVADGTLGRVRGAVEVDATGESFVGGYTFEVVGPDGDIQFAYNGPLAGTRVRVEPPDPIAMTLIPGTPIGTPAAAVGTGSVTVRVFVCPADLALAPWGGPDDQVVLLAACDPFDSPTVAPQLVATTDGEPARETEVAPGVYRWTGLPFGGYFVVGPQDPRLDVAQFDGLRVADAAGYALQNPGMTLDAATPEVELSFFYFFRNGPDTGTPSPTG